MTFKNEVILIISTCSLELSEFEFVKPIESILKSKRIKFFTEHYSSIKKDDLKKYDKVIICGTALKDFDYLKDINKFSWLKEFNKPLLGICAGMQVLGKVFGNELVDKEEIGNLNVEVKLKNKLTEKEKFNS